MRRSLTLLTALAATVVLAACGSDSKTDTSTISAAGSPRTATAAGPATTTARPTASSGGCQAAKAADATGRTVPKPTKADRLPTEKTAVVTLRTSCGPIIIQLDQKAQPITASAFAYLVKKRFYNGLTFHRIVPGFVIQGGDPDGNGQGGPGWSVRETPPANAAYRRGVVAMAKTGTDPAGTSGSQFFIVTGANANLPADYAIAGTVIGGDQAVTRIAAVPTGANSLPTEPVVIEKATLTLK